MGYRSEVILAVGPEVMPQFMVTMAKSPEARAMCFAEHDEMVKDYDGTKGALLFRWECIKWYESYEGVSAIQDFLEWCEGGAQIPTGEKNEDGTKKMCDAGDFYRFVRIGEEMDDNEIQGWGFDDIQIQRSASY
jgi:hypothetical protein